MNFPPIPPIPTALALLAAPMALAQTSVPNPLDFPGGPGGPILTPVAGKWEQALLKTTQEMPGSQSS